MKGLLLTCLLFGGTVSAGLLSNESFIEAGSSSSAARFWDGQAGGQVVASACWGNATREIWNNPPVGTNAVYVKGTWSGADHGGIRQMISGVAPGLRYHLKGWFYWDDGFTQSSSVQNLHLQFYDAATNLISGVSTNLMQGYFPGYTWAQRALSSVAPTGTVFLQVRFETSQTGSDGMLGVANLDLTMTSNAPAMPVRPSAAALRLSGPAGSEILSFGPSGVICWTNSAVGGTNLVEITWDQFKTWIPYAREAVTGSVMCAKVAGLHEPPGMILIPEGCFSMGNPTNAAEGWDLELPVHTVSVSPFYIDQCEITQAQWDSVYTWALTNGYDFSNAGSGKGARHPVQTISWYDAVKWCNARSEKEGRTPVYCRSASLSTVYRMGLLPLQNEWVRWTVSGYRLPTEAEWEKAARGGAEGHRFPWTDAETITHARANYKSSADDAYDVSPTRGPHPLFTDESFPYTSPVGTFLPNNYWLHDMAGNVGEWCWDWHDANYYQGSVGAQDPHGASTGTHKVCRGGYYWSDATACRCSCRLGESPTFSVDYIGLRCVLPATP